MANSFWRCGLDIQECERGNTNIVLTVTGNYLDIRRDSDAYMLCHGVWMNLN